MAPIQIIREFFVSESPIPLNNIDNFLDLLRKNFGVRMPIYQKNTCRLQACGWDLILCIAIENIGGKSCPFMNITVNTAATNLTEW
jgi:hypothetical protein